LEHAVAETDDTPADELDKGRAGPAVVADLLASMFKTPDGVKILTIAERLSSDFGVKDSGELARVLTEAIVRVRVDQEDLVLVTIDGLEWSVEPDLLDALLQSYQLSQALLYLIPDIEPCMGNTVTDTFKSGLMKFYSSLATMEISLVNRSTGGKKHRRPMEAKSVAMTFFPEWENLTGRQPIAWKDPATRQPRGDFWFFILAVCAEFEIERPSIDSVELWVKEARLTYDPQKDDNLGTPNK
jgi:hypothetical protein